MSPCSSDCIFRAVSALSGVQSLRILGGYELAPPDVPESTAAVHRQRKFQQLAEAGEGQVMTESHSSHDVSELEKSASFDEKSGTCSKKGMTRSKSAWRSRTTNTSALSRLLFGLM